MTSPYTGCPASGTTLHAFTRDGVCKFCNAVRELQPKVQVLHERSDDGGCAVRVWVDGTEVRDFTFEDVDPGRGYSRADWQERIADAQAQVGVDDSTFASAVVQALENNADNQFIRDEE